jgi:hypothetical protein
MGTSALLYYETAEHVKCYADTPGARPFIFGGQQPDGTYRYMFDLDSHNEHQNADSLLAYGKMRAASTLDKLTIIPTKRGGAHLVFRYHRPLNPGKIYDSRTGIHAGELLDGRTDPVDAPLLTTMELLDLLRAFYVPGVFQLDDDQAPAELRGAPTTPRKDYRRVGESLMGGWDRIRDWRERLDQKCAIRPRLASFRTRIRTHADRSAAYGAFVQSLMLHAADFGQTTAERCQMVAAMAIGVGAGGKEQARDYKIEADTAVLIAKILDGAPMQPSADGTIRCWEIPRWYSVEALPTPAPEPVKKPAHRPVGDRAKKVKRLEKLIRCWLEDSASGRIFYCIADLADDLICSPRSVSNYLADLEIAQKIKRGQLPGPGGRAYFDILPAFWHANKSEKAAESPPETPAFWHANENAAERIPMQESAECSPQCIEEEEAPKPCAPTPPASTAGPVDDAAIRAAIAAYFAHEAAQPRPRRAHEGQQRFTGRDQQVKASYPRVRHGPLPTPTPASYCPPGRVEEVDLPDFGPPAAPAGAQLLGAPLPAAPAGAPAPTSDAGGSIARLKQAQAARDQRMAAGAGVD